MQALAFYIICSLAPALILAIAVAGLAFGQKAVEGEVFRQIQGLVGETSARVIQTVIQSAYRPALLLESATRVSVAIPLGIVAAVFYALGRLHAKIVSPLQDLLDRC